MRRYSPENFAAWTVVISIIGILLLSGQVFADDDFEARLGKVITTLEKENTPYVWGGKSIKGADCSGVVYLAWKLAGKPFPRMTSRKMRAVFGIKGHWKNAEKFDLVFFTITPNRPYGHVGIYDRDGWFWQSGNSTGFVRRDLKTNKYWSRYFTGIGRIII